MPEMKRAAVLISPSRATLAVRFICSDEYAREEGGSCDELSAPLSTAPLVPYRSSASPCLRFVASSSTAPPITCTRFAMPSTAAAFGPLHRREATPSSPHTIVDRRGSATRGSQSPGSAAFLLDGPYFLGIYHPACRRSSLVFSISGELHHAHPYLPLESMACSFGTAPRQHAAMEALAHMVLVGFLFFRFFLDASNFLYLFFISYHELPAED